MLTASGDHGPYRITGAIYHSWWFLERYQERAVLECIRDAEKELREDVSHEPEDPDPPHGDP